MEQKNPLGPPTSAPGGKPEPTIANPQGPEATAGPMPTPNGEGNPALQEQDPGQIQADAHRIVTRGMEILHGPDTKDSIAAAIQASSDPVTGVADLAKSIMQKIDLISRQEGIEINVLSKINGSKELVNEIAELAEDRGAPVMDEADRELAWSVSMQDYVKEEIAAGRLDPAELEQGVMESMKSLDKEGMEAANQEMIRLDETATRRKANMSGAGATTEQPQPGQEVI